MIRKMSHRNWHEILPGWLKPKSTNRGASVYNEEYHSFLSIGRTLMFATSWAIAPIPPNLWRCLKELWTKILGARDTQKRWWFNPKMTIWWNGYHHRWWVIGKASMIRFPLLQIFWKKIANTWHPIWDAFQIVKVPGCLEVWQMTTRIFGGLDPHDRGSFRQNAVGYTSKEPSTYRWQDEYPGQYCHIVRIYVNI